MVFGMIFVIVIFGIDLFVGLVVVFLVMVLVWMFFNVGLLGWFIFIIGLLIGLFVGVVFGLVIVYGKLFVFIVMLVMMSVVCGLIFVIFGGIFVVIFDVVNQLGVDVGLILVFVIMFVLVGVVCWFMLLCMVLGCFFYVIGGNEEVVCFFGILVCCIFVIVYVLVGVFVGLVGLVLVGWFFLVQFQVGFGYEFDVIVVVVIGGVLLLGGFGKVSGIFIGVVLLVVICNGFNIFNVILFWQQVVIGCVIVLVVGFDVFRFKKEF